MVWLQLNTVLSPNLNDWKPIVPFITHLYFVFTAAGETEKSKTSQTKNDIPQGKKLITDTPEPVNSITNIQANVITDIPQPEIVKP